MKRITEQPAVAFAGILLGSMAILFGCGPTEPEPQPSLQAGEVFRVLSPNGGETYNYGDSIAVTWLQNTKYAQNGMIRIHRGPARCQYWMNLNEYLQVTRDTDTTKPAYFKPVNDSIVMGVHKIGLVDKDMIFADCQIVFEGNQMSLEVYDEYGQVGANTSDLTDGPFTVVK